MSNTLFGGTTLLDGCARVIISACVIGRNEGTKVADCGRSLEKLSLLGVTFERIFVDSASTDGSAELAEAVFDQVIELEPNAHLNASAGRYVGTAAAKGDWLLFLDGDMTLADDFLPKLGALLERNDKDRGLVGHTRDRYPDGRTRLTLEGYNKDGWEARLFGGACVLPRQALLRAGNWNPRLYSNEEAELYGRLKAVGVRIFWTDTVMAEHHTPNISRYELLKGLFSARGFLGKKYYGLGQVVAASCRGGSLLAFLYIRSELAVTASFAIASVIALVTFGIIPAVSFASLFLVYALARDGIKAPILYIAYTIQIIRGFGRYPNSFRPRIRRQIARGGARHGPAHSPLPIGQDPL